MTKAGMTKAGMTNVVALVGRLARPASERVLPSGDRLATYEVTVERGGARAESVPVAWLDAPASATVLDTGDEVVVVGRVRRRFFRTPTAGTQSRTEVVADAVVPRRHAKRAAALLAQAACRLEEAMPDPERLRREKGGPPGP